jgi:hypothetical protein
VIFQAASLPAHCFGSFCPSTNAAAEVDVISCFVVTFSSRLHVVLGQKQTRTLLLTCVPEF